MDEAKIHTFLDKMLADLGGAFGIGLVRLGGRLGLYQALRQDGPMTSATLATQTGLKERYVREWLAYNAASGYLTYDSHGAQFTLPKEHAEFLANPESELYMLPAFDAATAYLDNQPQVEEAFKSGGGVGWANQSGCLFCAVAQFFRPGYKANLVENWLPAMTGVVERLHAGAKVADVGCGHGHSTLLMAEAFPNSEFNGFDFHDQSIEQARRHAYEHGGFDNVRFEVATAKDYAGRDYDLVTCFDCLHDMGDPVGASRHVRQSLVPDGKWLVVEPKAADSLEDNINPVSRLYYAASTMVCVPASLDQEVGAALGAQAGPRKLRETIVDGGGFSSMRIAAETPFNVVLEVTP